MSKTRFMNAADAAALIQDGSTVAISGNGAGMTSAEAIFAAIEARFLATGHPRGLTLVHSLGIGDRESLGANRFAHEGLLRKIVAAHFTWSPRIQQMIRDNAIEAYCLPAGVVQQLLREIGAGRPGLFTHSGLGTFVDPRQDGGRCNARSTDTLVELLTIDGAEVLRYKPFRVDAAIIRGSYADTRGNLSLQDEAVDLDVHTMALAAHNGGGIVLAQAKQVVPTGTLAARSVRVPGIMIDAVVEEPGQELFYGSGYDASIAGVRRAALGPSAAAVPAKRERRIIARRAAREIRPGSSLNFGFGIPGGIFGVIAEQDIENQLWISVEQGTHNGRMLDDRLFGASRNPDAILPSIEQFDYYSGGGIDVAFLGMGEADANGNVNVSHLGGNLIGPGGFMEIAQNAKKVVFCGTFLAGSTRKFVKQVERITFSASYARRRGQEVLFVTDRTLFRLSDTGLRLIELAPGIDLGNDVLKLMDFAPELGELEAMSAECFR